MNTGNMSNDEANAIGNFIDQLNILTMKGLIFNTEKGVVIRYDYHADFKCRDSNDELPYVELQVHPYDLKNLYWDFSDGTVYDFDIVEEIKEPKGYLEYPGLVLYAKLKSAITEPGINLIAAEREEQIKKHNILVTDDVVYNESQQLRIAAQRLLFKTEGFDSADLEVPNGWSKKRWHKMVLKPYPERLVIAGALIAAEIDRLNAKIL